MGGGGEGGASVSIGGGEVLMGDGWEVGGGGVGVGVLMEGGWKVGGGGVEGRFQLCVGGCGVSMPGMCLSCVGSGASCPPLFVCSRCRAVLSIYFPPLYC